MVRNKIIAEISWVDRKTDGVKYDVDLSILMLSSDSKVRFSKDFIFFNNLESVCGSVKHFGDNNKIKSKIEEQVLLNLEDIPIEVKKIAIVVSIQNAEKLNQNFGQINKCNFRLLTENEQVLIDINLSEEYSTQNGLVIECIKRVNSQWEIENRVEKMHKKLSETLRLYGVKVI